MHSIKTYIIDKHVAVSQALQMRLKMDAALEIIYAGPYLQHLAESVGFADVALVGLASDSQANREQTEQIVIELSAQKTAVILLTPYIDEVERELALNAGAYRYLLKTINTTELIAEITTVYHEKHAK